MNTTLLPGKHEVSSKITIDAPTETVWNVLKDFGHVSDWAPSVTSSYYLTDQLSGIGTGRHCDIEGFGSIQEYVTDWQEGEGFTYRVTPLGPLAESNSSWRLSRIDDKTTELQVTLRYEVRFGLFGIMMHKLVMRKKLEQAIPETLEATKNHVESMSMSTASIQALSAAI